MKIQKSSIREGRVEIAEDKSFEVIDADGNRWRLMEHHYGLEIMLSETSTGMLKSMSVLPQSGNVVIVRPS